MRTYKHVPNAINCENVLSERRCAIIQKICVCSVWRRKKIVDSKIIFVRVETSKQAAKFESFQASWPTSVFISLLLGVRVYKDSLPLLFFWIFIQRVSISLWHWWLYNGIEVRTFRWYVAPHPRITVDRGKSPKFSSNFSLRMKSFKLHWNWVVLMR